MGRGQEHPEIELRELLRAVGRVRIFAAHSLSSAHLLSRALDHHSQAEAAYF